LLVLYVLVAHTTGWPFSLAPFSSVGTWGRKRTYNVILSRVRIFTSWTARMQKSQAPCYPDECILYSGAENFEMSCRLLENLCSLGHTIHCAAVAVYIVKCYNPYWNLVLYLFKECTIHVPMLSLSIINVTLIPNHEVSARRNFSY